MARLGSVSKLVEFANKTLKTTNRKNCGKLVRTIEDAATGTKIEVFQKKTGSRLFGNRRTVTTRFAEGTDEPIEQTVRQKKGHTLSTFTIKKDDYNTDILTQINTKTGETEANVRKWLNTTNDNNELVQRQFITKKVYRIPESNATIVDDLDYSTGEMNRTIFQRFNNEEGRGIIRTNDSGSTKTFVDKDNIMHQQTTSNPIDGSEEISWLDCGSYYRLNGAEWKGGSKATTKTSHRGRNITLTAIGLTMGAPLVFSLLNNKDNNNIPTEPKVTNTSIPAAPADSVHAAPSDSIPVVNNDSIPVVNNDSIPAANNDSIPVVNNDSIPVEPVNPEPVEENDEEDNDEDQQPPVQQTPPSDNLFNGEINEITKASVEIEKGDCLWNIAKRELQAANPGKTITNAQILKQVKEFGRLNPEMFGENPSLQKLDLIYPDKQLKLCA